MSPFPTGILASAGQSEALPDFTGSLAAASPQALWDATTVNKDHGQLIDGWPDSSNTGAYPVARNAQSGTVYYIEDATPSGKPAVVFAGGYCDVTPNFMEAGLPSQSIVAVMRLAETTMGHNHTLIGGGDGGLQLVFNGDSRPVLVKQHIAVIGNATELLTAGEWYVITATFTNNDRWSIESNGVDIGSGTHTENLWTGYSVKMAVDGAGGNERFHGEAALIAKFDRVLTEEERLNITNEMLQTYL